jgi:hypothetical protein
MTPTARLSSYASLSFSAPVARNVSKVKMAVERDETGLISAKTPDKTFGYCKANVVFQHGCCEANVVFQHGYCKANVVFQREQQDLTDVLRQFVQLPQQTGLKFCITTIA